jgi:hypothetical protein
VHYADRTATQDMIAARTVTMPRSGRDIVAGLHLRWHHGQMHPPTNAKSKVTLAGGIAVSQVTVTTMV